MEHLFQAKDISGFDQAAGPEYMLILELSS